MPDIIYYRQWGTWYPGIGFILKFVPSVIEINTNELREANLWSKLHLILYLFTSNILYNSVAGFIHVTKEISHQFIKYKKPYKILPNSFTRDIVDLKPTSNSFPTFIFIATFLSIDASWHGEDKLVLLAKAFPRSKFIIVGIKREQYNNNNIPSNMVFYGKVNDNDLKYLLEISDIGIGT